MVYRHKVETLETVGKLQVPGIRDSGYVLVDGVSKNYHVNVYHLQQNPPFNDNNTMYIFILNFHKWRVHNTVLLKTY